MLQVNKPTASPPREKPNKAFNIIALGQKKPTMMIYDDKTKEESPRNEITPSDLTEGSAIKNSFNLNMAKEKTLLIQQEARRLSLRNTLKIPKD